MLQQSAAVQTEYFCLANMNVWCAKSIVFEIDWAEFLTTKDLWDIA